LENTRHFEFADRLVELRDKHKALKDEAAAVWHEYEAAERELITLMVTSECMQFNRAGSDFFISDRTTYKVDDLLKPDFYAAVREHDEYPEDLFDIHAGKISSKIREWIANNDGVVPDWLEGLFEVKTSQGISIKNSTKGKKHKNY
jgi:hypothetical protein